MDCPAGVDPAALRVFRHYLYEYRHGVRALFMMTLSQEEARPVMARLVAEEIAHFVQEVTTRKVNLFFGRAPFVETSRWLAGKPLCQLSAEEDFMLGTLLGYDREQQCVRFLARRARRGGGSVSAH